MAWKCPNCGNPENLDELLRCVCDHEIKEKDLESLRLPPPKIEVYSQENKYGHGSRRFHFAITALQAVSIVVLLGFLISASENVTVVVGPLCLGFFITFIIIEAVVKKQINVRTFILRQEDSIAMYRTFLLLMIIMALACFGKFIYQAVAK